MTLVIPMVTWQDAREEWVVDIYSRLLRDRIIFLGTPIDEQIANRVVAELLHRESEQSDRDIAIYVNSPGGSVYAGLTRGAQTLYLHRSSFPVPRARASQAPLAPLTQGRRRR